MQRNSQDILNQIKLTLKDPPTHLVGKVIDNHVILDIHRDSQHYWSPHLDLRVEEEEDNPNIAIISGLIGPRPTVWTLFVFIYFTVGVITFFMSSYGISKMMINEHSHLIWAFPLGIVFMLSAYQAGKYGERLGADQIEIMKDFIRNSIRIDGK